MRNTTQRRLGATILVVSLLGGGLTAMPPARGVDFAPTTTAELTDAVAEANTNDQPDVIDLGGQTFMLSAQLTITPDSADPANTLTITNGTLTRDVNPHRILQVQADAVTFLDGVRISGGTDTSAGGGILNFGTLALTSSTVSGNHAFGGGGIFNSGVIALASSTVSGNLGGDFGGGIFNSGTLSLTSSTVSGNRAFDGGGGGIRNSGTLTLNSSSVSNNTATDGVGGGIRNFGTLTLNSSTMSGNTATDSGGAIHSGADAAILTVTSSTISGNSAGIGGGINNDGALTVTSSTISGNRSGVGGGGIRNSGTLTLTSSTISGNVASDVGGGILNSGTLTLTSSTISGNIAASLIGGVYNAGGTATVLGSILAGNSGAPAPDCFGTFMSEGFNVIGNDGQCSGFGADDLIGVDPELGPLALNAPGTTQTHAIAATSPARDLHPADQGCPDTDQRGVPRPRGGACDAGAFEVEDPATDGLFDAVAVANTNDQPDVIDLGGQTFTLTAQLTIAPDNANPANILTIRNGTLQRTDDAGRILDVQTDAVVFLDGVTITGGVALEGGGIRTSGTLTVTSSTISDNRTTGSASGSGGGIRNSGTLTVTSSTISGNAGGVGGGGIRNSGTLTLTSSTISGNSVSDAGGGILNSGNLTLTSSTISGNIAGSLIGGVYNAGGTATVLGSILAGNSGAPAPDCFGTFMSEGFNVIGNDGQCSGFGADDLIGVDPELGPLALNAPGTTQTHAIAATSPARDLHPADQGCPDTDQRGVTRPQGEACDSGAFELEIPAPDTSITTGPADGSVIKDTTPTFGFTSSAPDATFECSVDGADFTACTSEYKLSKLSEGHHTFRVRSVDDGVADSTPATRSFIVDAKEPKIVTLEGPDKKIAVDEATFTFTADEDVADFLCSLDGSDEVDCASGVTYTDLAEGKHTFTVRAVDVSGRLGPLTERKFTVDLP